MSRGIVATPTETFETDASGAMLSKACAGSWSGWQPRLRLYTLYWDRIDIPIFELPQFETFPFDGCDETPFGADGELLLSEGILSRTLVRPIAPPLTDGRVSMLTQALDYWENREPGQWGLALQERTPPDVGWLKWAPVIAPPTTAARGVLVELYDALPAPARNTPLDKILRFKQKRQSELLELRAGLDELYHGIITSGDVRHATNAAIAKVETALRNMHQVCSESFVTRLLKTMKVEVNVCELLTIAAAASEVAQRLGLPPHALLISSAIGAAASMIKFELIQAPHFAGPDRAFAYVHSAIEELGD